MLEQPLTSEAIADPRTYANDAALHALLSRLRSEGPIHRVEAEGYLPFWLLVRHADIVEMEKKADKFISAPVQSIIQLKDEARATIAATGGSSQMRNVAAMDGPEHKIYRNITQSYFTPKGLTEVVRGIEELSVEFVDRIIATGGHCNFAEFAMSFPLRVIMQMLGVPPQDEALMLRLSQQTLTSEDSGLGSGGDPAAILMEVFAYFSKIVEERRADPTSDLASVIANAKVDGKYLSAQDIFGYFFVVATAGHDTTSYAMTGGLLALLNNPSELEKLRADPSLLPNAVEEILRWVTPVKQFCRTATEDCELLGKQIKKGDVVSLMYPSANRDEDVFEDAFSFRVDRKPNRHLAFGTGPHVCLGQYLARFELITFFREFLARVSEIALSGETRYVESTFVGGPKHLPISFR